MAKSLKSLFTQIADSELELDTSNLVQLSDMDDESLAGFSEIWPTIDVARRREIMKQLAGVCQQDFTVDFNPIALIGMKDRDSLVRLAAIDTLWDCENPAMIPHLIRLVVSDPELEVQASAATALGHFVLMGELGQLSERQFAQVLSTLLNIAQDATKPYLIRCRALESIAAADIKEIPALILEAYNSGIDSFRTSAIAAMGRTADDSWGPKILKELYNVDPNMRYHAVQAAGQLELQDAIDQLIELLEDPNRQVVQASIQSLGRIGGTEAREALLPLLEDSEFIELVEEVLESIDIVTDTSSLSYDDYYDF